MALAAEGDAPRPFQDLAHLAPPVSNDTYGVLTVTEETYPENGYIIDACGFEPEPGVSTSSLIKRFTIHEGWVRAPTWVPASGLTLFLNGAPQPVWQMPTDYAPWGAR